MIQQNLNRVMVLCYLLTKGGDMDDVRAESIIKVISEYALFPEFIEGFICCSDNSSMEMEFEQLSQYHVVSLRLNLKL